jgi:hypothetical protein
VSARWLVVGASLVLALVSLTAPWQAEAQVQPLPREPLKNSKPTSPREVPRRPIVGSLPTPQQGPQFSFLGPRDPLYATHVAQVYVQVTGVPDGSLVGVRPNPRRHSEETGFRLSAGGRSLGTVAHGQVRDLWIFTAENRIVSDRGLILDVEIEIRTPGEADPKFIYVRADPLPMTRMKSFTETNTAGLAAVFQLDRTPTLPFPGMPASRWTEACEGEVGGHRVGKRESGGKLIFRAHTGLKGANCVWQGKGAVPPPVRVVAMTWSARTQGSCRRPPADLSLPPVSCGEFGLLRTDWADVGDGRQVMATLRRCHRSNETPRMRLALKCPGRPNSDDYVESVLESVELEIPEDWDRTRFIWGTAPFNPG